MRAARTWPESETEAIFVGKHLESPGFQHVGRRKHLYRSRGEWPSHLALSGAGGRGGSDLAPQSSSTPDSPANAWGSGARRETGRKQRRREGGKLQVSLVSLLPSKAF